MQQSNKINQLRDKLEKLIASQKLYVVEIMQLRKIISQNITEPNPNKTEIELISNEVTLI